MDSSVSPKDEIWFLRVCHHISNAVYTSATLHPSNTRLQMDYQVCNIVLRYSSIRCARKHTENVCEYAAVTWGNHNILTICWRRGVDENCVLLGYDAASNDNFLPTFRDNLSVPYSWFKNAWPLNKGPTGCPETSVSVRNFYYSLRNSLQERSSLTVFCFLF
jgi:hypothetical protein